eukprot:CAMPEP_0196581004 /NCGR_PEP_ID=MMETSP1081-20130531/31912_1 /TAXON_ID=36882 /ORGANISM="Pyramimonas amylifera, Strain CCMP720" /LENGTH=334 /DNA_ID=CAMNT_0041901079 /DNA_START=113 /DNA_END=1114 /DNA_ORIENTATION=+
MGDENQDAKPEGGWTQARLRTGLTKTTTKGIKRTSSYGKVYRQGGSQRRRKEDEVPGVLPYFMLGAACICSLAMPLYVLFYGGLPEPNQTFLPPTHGSEYVTRAVVDRPKEGEHFVEGEILPEGRALGDIHHYTHKVVEFTDFFCPHCREAHSQVMEPLIRDYVPFGRVRVESHPVAFLSDDSLSASHAALCAQEQHKYWEVRELLFQVDLTNRTAAEADDIDIFDNMIFKRIGLLAQLDMFSFAKCFNSGRHKDEVKRISQLARNLGIHETPTFLVNNVKYEGMIEWEKLLKILNARPKKPLGHRGPLPKMPVNESHPMIKKTRVTKMPSHDE